MSKYERRLKSIKDKLTEYSKRFQGVLVGKTIPIPSFFEEDLHGIDLQGLDLTRVSFRHCNLKHANFNGTALGEAIFTDSTLTDATFVGADLTYAALRNCWSSGANFENARMRGAILSAIRGGRMNFKGADLRDTILTDAGLRWSNIDEAILPNFSIVLEEGSFMGYKKVANIDSPDDFMIAQLLIPEDALRTSSLVGRKCRANKVVVLRFYTVAKQEIIEDVVGLSITQLRQTEWPEEEITDEDLEGITAYRQGQTVYSDSFDDNILVECTNGIHFFMTFREAVEYQI